MGGLLEGSPIVIYNKSINPIIYKLFISLMDHIWRSSSVWPPVTFHGKDLKKKSMKSDKVLGSSMLFSDCTENFFFIG